MRVGACVVCGSRVTEHSQRSRCPVDGSWPRRPVPPDRPVAQLAQQAQRRAGKEEDLHNSDGREEKLETSRSDGKQQRTVCCADMRMAVVVAAAVVVVVKGMYCSWLGLSLVTRKARVGGGRVGEMEGWIDDRYVQPWRMQGKKKRVPVGVVSCLDLSCPGYAVLLCCACSVGRSAWAIWFQFGPVQIRARPQSAK